MHKPALSAVAAALMVSSVLMSAPALADFMMRLPLKGDSAPAVAAWLQVKDGSGTLLGTILFPDTLAGSTSAPLTINVLNTSATPVTFAGGGSTVLVSPPFAVSGTGCVGTLAPGATCWISLTFSPTVTGATSTSMFGLITTEGLVYPPPTVGGTEGTGGAGLPRTRVVVPNPCDNAQWGTLFNFNAQAYLTSLGVTPSTTEDIEMPVSGCYFQQDWQSATIPSFSTGVLPNGATLYLVNDGITAITENNASGTPIVLQIDSPTVIEGGGETNVEITYALAAVKLNANLTIASGFFGVMTYSHTTVVPAYPSQWISCPDGQCVQYDLLIDKAPGRTLTCPLPLSCTTRNTY